VMVCQARAAAHGHSEVARYSDPTALALLPEEARRAVERFHASAAPANVRERVGRAIFVRRANMMVTRTVAIDDALRAAKSQQVVILGAGLDGRAWRMPELRDVTVFEVDHPDSQRMKRERAAALTPTAKDIRFVAVDFERDSLDAALAAAGHDSAKTTTWIWEGVVMYLERADIESTLAIVRQRSAPRSRLSIAYISPALIRWLAGLFVRRLGEPFRSVFTAEQMKELLSRHGFEVVRDEDVSVIGRALHPALAKTTRPMRHLRIVTAERR